MLFTFGNERLESEKERNLYYKFFAGYYFNELIVGWEDRLYRFAKLVENGARNESVALPRPITLRPDTTHVTFDYHAYLLGCSKDKGELADILVNDSESRWLIAMEVKFLTNWSFKKDIVAMSNRIEEFRNLERDVSVVQCLLVSKMKWQGCKAKEKHTNSNYARFLGAERREVVLLFWEDFISECADGTVRDFLSQHLLRNRDDFKRVREKDQRQRGE